MLKRAQVVRLTAVLANGTVAEFSDTQHPGLFRAFKTSVGRLGVVTTVTFQVRRDPSALDQEL